LIEYLRSENTIPFNIYDKEWEVNRARYTIDGEAQREPTKQWEETTIEVVVAVKAVVIVKAEEMEDSKAEETGAQLQVPNNKKWSSFHMGLEENARQWVTILARTISSKLFKRPTRTVRILRYPYETKGFDSFTANKRCCCDSQYGWDITTIEGHGHNLPSQIRKVSG
jgi:hypothetical protein